MSKNKQQIKKVLNEIKNDIYYEKLGSMLSKLRSWLSEKDRFTKQYILEKSSNILDTNATINQKLTNYSTVFVQFVQQLSDSLVDYESEMYGNSKNSNNSSKKIKAHTSQKPQYFQKTKQLWQARKESMKKIKKFSQIIIPSIKKQSVENTKLLLQLDYHIKKMRPSIQKSSAQYMKKIELASIKNNQKQFQFNKIKEMSSIFNLENIEYEEFMGKVGDLSRKIIQKEGYLMENINSNIVTLNQIINGCFKGFQNYMIVQTEEFRSQIKRMTSQVQLIMQNNQIYRKNIQMELKQSLQQISKQLIQQISVASWTISSKPASQQKLFSPKKGILTLDNKFLVLKQDQKQVENQINLIQATINETQVLGEVLLKPKKKSSMSSKVVIKFEKVQNLDQFKLHLKRTQEEIQ